MSPSFYQGMAHQYFMIGGDGKTYGPVSCETLQEWIADGRLSPQTQIRADTEAVWRGAGSIPELIWPNRPTPPPAPPPPKPFHVGPGPTVSRPISSESESTAPPSSTGSRQIPPEAALTVLRHFASWYLWIGALTLFNIVVSLSGRASGFSIATTTPGFINQLAERLPQGGLLVAVALSGLVLGIIGLLGWMARHGAPLAYLAGAILYAIDGLLALFQLNGLSLMLSIAFHGYVVWQLFRGYQLATHIRGSSL